MEELFDSLVPMIFIIVALAVTFSSKTKKAKNSAAQVSQHRQSVPHAAPQSVAPRPAAPARPAPAIQPVQPAAAGPMQPRVQTTVSVSRHDHTGMFEGSMNADSLEGEDPFHDHGQRAVHMPSQESDRIINCSLDEEDEMPEAEPALDLEWNDSRSLVKAFVMQEILTRPSDRKR